MKIQPNTKYRVNFVDNYRNLNGREILIEGRWMYVSGESFLSSSRNGNIACLLADLRLQDHILKLRKEGKIEESKQLSLDSIDETKIYSGHIDGLGYIILESELSKISNFEYISIGASPIDEPCVKVDSKKEYLKEMKAECERFKKGLESYFSDEIKTGIRLEVKQFAHDFGPYCEVVCFYDTESHEQIEAALLIEKETPNTWEVLEKLKYEKEMVKDGK